MRVLMKDQAAAEENGIWKVTQVGTVGVPLILTRTDDFNIAAALGNYKGVIQTNAYTMVGSGTIAGETGWAVSALGGSFAVGTDGGCIYKIRYTIQLAYASSDPDRFSYTLALFEQDCLLSPYKGM
jgi:hypothetical protein